MTLFALTEFWNEFYAAGGFWVGVIGTVVGVAGFWVTIAQIRATRKAAEAARDAAEKTLAESKESYERFVGTFASRLLSELEAAVNAKLWRVVQLRCGDLAELFATLPVGRDAAVAESGRRCVPELRDLVRECAELEARGASKLPKATADKWGSARLLAHVVLDHLRLPFREVNHGGATDRNPPPSPPGVGPGTPHQDEGPAGELGSAARP